MKQKDVFNKIGGILLELTDQYQYLQENESDLNELEIELFVANAHFLKDHAEILYKFIVRGAASRQLLMKPVPSFEPKPEPPVAKPVPVAAKPVPPVVKPAPPVVKTEPVAVKPEMAIEPEVVAAKPEPPVISPEVPVVKAELLVIKPEVPSVEQIEEAGKQETKETEKFFEPLVQLKQADKGAEEKHDTKPVKVKAPENADEEEEPVASINIEDAAASDSYSLTRETPDAEKPELVLNEAAENDEASVTEIKLLDEPAKEAEEIKASEEVAEVVPAKTEEPAASIENSEDAKAEQTEDGKPVSINQKISSQLEQKAKQGVPKPISDLKLAITMNDKMLYVKELFNGYNLAYSEAIEILNRFNTFEEAARFLKTNYVTKNKWDSKPATTEKFYALLQRRYPPVL